MAAGPTVCWVDGRIEPIQKAVLRADDSAYSEGRGCYTTARVVGGRVRLVERHVQRVVRAAKELGLGDVDPELARSGLEELAAAAFGGGDGIVRLQASRDGAGHLHLVGVARDIGPESAEWSAVIVSLPHEGGGLSAGLKVTSRLTIALAADAARAAGADEALLLDASGALIEGACSNIFVSGADGGLATPPVADGPVAGITRGFLLERVPGIALRSITAAELRSAREIVAANAVRGAVPIVRLDGHRVGDARRGPWAERLAAALAAD